MSATISKIILRSRIKRVDLSRHKKFLPWDKIDKIALIIEQQEGLNKHQIDKFIDDTKKYVEVFFIETRSKSQSYADWHCFSKKNISVLSLPDKKTMSELKNKTFDVVINTCAESNLFAIALCASLPAYLICSGNNRFNLADLILKKTEPFNLKNYLDETVRYLKMIKI